MVFQMPHVLNKLFNKQMAQCLRGCVTKCPLKPCVCLMFQIALNLINLAILLVWYSYICLSVMTICVPPLPDNATSKMAGRGKRALGQQPQEQQ